MADDEVQRIAESRLGRVLRGKYRLDGILGVGGMATVYVGTHRNRKRFAVKMLHPDLSTRENIRARFLREGYVANSVEHPGAVAVLDDDVAEDGSAFLVMELLDGASVDEVRTAQGGKLPLPLVVSIGDALLEVLAAAHGKGIVHRDIKPANLFLTSDGALKVLDFGIARLRDATGSGATSTGQALGTPAFMAPEQAMAKAGDVDAETDLWAAGATLFTLASGSFVHEGENGQQVMIAAATKPARSLRSVSPDVPGALAAVVDRALAFDKKDRWPDAAAMRDALARACVESLGGPVSPLPRTQKPVSSGGGAVTSGEAFEATVSADSAEGAISPLASSRAVGPMSSGVGGGVSRTATSPGTPWLRRRWPVVVPLAAAVLVAGVVAVRHQAHAPRVTACGVVSLRRDGPRCDLPLSAEAAGKRYEKLHVTEVDGRVTSIEQRAYAAWPPEIATTAWTVARDAGGAVTGIVKRNARDVEVEHQKWSDGGRRIDFVDVDGVTPRHWGETRITAIRRELDPQGRVTRELYLGPTGKPRSADKGVFGHAYEYGKGDKVIRDTMLGADGRPSPDDAGCAVVEVADDGLPGERETRTFDADGKPLPVDGAALVHTRWTESGEKAGLQAFAADAKPAVYLSTGAHETRLDWDPAQRTREVRTLDAEGAPTPRKGQSYTTWRRTFDAAGRQALEEFLDAQGNRVLERNNAAALRITWSASGDPEEYAWLDPGGAPMQGRFGFARQTNVWDAAGNLVEHRHFDEAGRPQPGRDDGPVQRKQFDARGLETSGTSLSPDGKPVAGRFGVSSVRVRYDRLRNQIEQSDLDVDGHPTADADGVSVHRWKFDADDDLVEESFLDASGAPVMRRGECAIERSKVDDVGQTIEEECDDLRGRPTPSKDGYAFIRYVHDRDGNVIDEATFGPRGEPTLRSGGYARKHTDYDARGHAVRVALFDAAGAPAAGDDGWAVEKTTWDDRGLDVRVDDLDASGKPVLASSGSASRTRTRDARGNVVEEASLGVDGTPVAPGRDGFATKKTRYDDRNQLVQEELFDTDGKPATGKDGWSMRQLAYDERGNLVAETFLDPGARPVLLARRAYASQHWVYDTQQRSIETRCFGLNDAPARCAEGAAVVRTKRDSWGHPIETSYLDGSGAPATSEEGKIVVRQQYDDSGRVVEERDVDAADRPLVAQDGCAGHGWRYDPQGRRIEETCLGADGKPAMHVDGWAIRNTGYDARGNIVETSSRGPSGALVAGKDGVARQRSRFDDRNDLLEMAFFDAQDRPTHDKAGVSVTRMTYDEAGKEVGRELVDEKGRTVKPKK